MLEEVPQDSCTTFQNIVSSLLGDSYLVYVVVRVKRLSASVSMKYILMPAASSRSVWLYEHLLLINSVLDQI